MEEVRIYLELADRRIEVPTGESTIGRSRSSTVVIADRGISRSHALVSASGKRVSIQDLNSANGTYINGRRLAGEVLLRTGDVLTLGKTQAKLLIEEPTEALPKPLPPPPSADPTRSEAVAVGDALAVGEVLAKETGSWERTQPMFRVDRAASAGEPAVEESASSEEPVSVAEPVVAEEPVAAEETLGPAGAEIADLATANLSEEGLLVEEGDLTPAPESPESTQPAVESPSPKATGTITGSFLEQSGEQAVASTRGEVLPSLDDLDRDLAESRRTASAEQAPEEPAEPSAPPSVEATRPAFLPAAAIMPRLAAFLVDAAWMGAAAFGLAMLLRDTTPLAPMFVASVAYAALSALVSVVGWSRWGTTPGKRLFGLYVCREAGWIGISAGRALLRWLGYTVSAVLLGGGFIAGVVSTSRRALHDRIAGTYVGAK